MSKQETFRRLLAGEYDDARHVTIKTDKKLLLKMRKFGWWPYSSPLSKDKPDVGPLETHKEGSAEWRKDIKQALRALKRV